MSPAYDLDKIKFATDPATFERAVSLYENGKVTKFSADNKGYFAQVSGTHLYEVYVSRQYYDRGDCTCYLGQDGILCKHMVALAIRVVMKGKKLSDKDKKLVTSPVVTGTSGTLKKSELLLIKKSITANLRLIKAYNGPSKTWFAYQNSLREGCSRLAALISDFPVGIKSAQLLVDLLLRLDTKLCRGGVDDSDGTVGNCMQEIVGILEKYAKIDPECRMAFNKLENRSTSFGWEEPLINLLK